LGGAQRAIRAPRLQDRALRPASSDPVSHVPLVCTRCRDAPVSAPPSRPAPSSRRRPRARVGSVRPRLPMTRFAIRPVRAFAARPSPFGPPFWNLSKRSGF